MMRNRTGLIDSLMLLAAILLAWEALYKFAGPDALASPVDTVLHAFRLMSGRTFWHHTASTGGAFLLACGVALVGGVAIGLAIGQHRLAREVGEPILGTLYSIPKITLYPVILLIFGLGLSAKIAFGAVHGIFPVALSTIGAVKNIRQVYPKAARTMRLTPMQTIVHILVPAALPEIMTGMRIGASTTLLGTLVSELFASDRGLGFALIRAMNDNRVTEIMALTLILFAFAACMNFALLKIERRINRAGDA